MTSFSQIVRLYRVSERPMQTQARKAITRPERPNTGQKGQKETNGPFIVTQQLSTLESSSLLSVITNNSA